METRGVFAPLLAMLAASTASAQQSGRPFGGGIIVGLEYAVVDNRRIVKAMAREFAETGMPGMKLLGEAAKWGDMQRGPNLTIDFTKLDLFVREYQSTGFTELTVALMPHSSCGSVNVGLLKSSNASPKPQYRAHFQKWIAAVVERYDGDGNADMPGLRWPVRHLEIGSELSNSDARRPAFAATYTSPRLRHRPVDAA